MLDFYQLLKLNQLIKNPKIKLLGVYLANLIGIRHYSVRIDPTLHCNLECRMCYFSDNEWKQKNKGLLSVDELNGVAKMLFPKALQVVIGCGAEPTIHKNFMVLIQQAHQFKVPNISMVTNGLLLTKEQIEEMAKLNLKELIISMHGVNKHTYEKMMTKGEHEKFLNLMDMLKEVRSKYSYPKIRINYTVNKENLQDLSDFFNVFGRYPIDTIQLRPVMEIGGVYSESISEAQLPIYNNIVSEFKEQSLKRKINFLANTKDITYKEKNQNTELITALYRYVSPRIGKQIGISWTENNYKDYMKAVEWRKNVLSAIFRRKASDLKPTDRFLKYDIA